MQQKYILYKNATDSKYDCLFRILCGQVYMSVVYSAGALNLATADSVIIKKKKLQLVVETPI